MLSLAREETRKSLKSVFENIFTRYDREFDEGDEVDLMSMKIVKPGGHLARLPTQKIGSVFKKKTSNIGEACLAENPRKELSSLLVTRNPLDSSEITDEQSAPLPVNISVSRQKSVKTSKISKTDPRPAPKAIARSTPKINRIRATLRLEEELTAQTELSSIASILNSKPLVDRNRMEKARLPNFLNQPLHIISEGQVKDLFNEVVKGIVRSDMPNRFAVDHSEGCFDCLLWGVMQEG